MADVGPMGGEALLRTLQLQLSCQLTKPRADRRRRSSASIVPGRQPQWQMNGRWRT